MAKESGIGAAVSVDDATPTLQDISNDITNYQLATPRTVQDTTGIDKAAFERLLLLADFTITMNGVFNDAAGKSHAVFKTVPSTSVVRTVTHVVSGQTLSCETIVTDYNLTRAAGGELTWSAPASLQSGTAPTWS